LQVFLTHLHSDHIADLATFYVGAMFGRTKPWEVWGPSGEDASTGTAHSIEGLRQVCSAYRPCTACCQRPLRVTCRFVHHGCSTCQSILRDFPDDGRNLHHQQSSIRHPLTSAKSLLLRRSSWDTVSRRRIDLIGRKDRGDQVEVHEFDFSKRNQVIYDRKVGLGLGGVGPPGTADLSAWRPQTVRSVSQGREYLHTCLCAAEPADTQVVRSQWSPRAAFSSLCSGRARHLDAREPLPHGRPCRSARRVEGPCRHLLR